MNEAVPLILSEEQVTRFRILPRRPAAKAGVAVVYSTTKGGYELVQGRATAGETAFAPYSMRYEVDTGQHATTWQISLPSSDGGMQFQAVIEAVWQVTAPVEVVRHRIRDGVEAIRQHLIHQLRDLCRSYDVEDHIKLEEQINAGFARRSARTTSGEAQTVDWNRLVEGITLTRVSVGVQLDAAGEEWLRAKRDAERQKKLLSATHELDADKQANELKLQKLRHEHELAMERMRSEFDAEREQDRIRLYQNAIDSGNEALLALHLARNPDEAGRVLNMIMENKALTDKARIELLAKMIEEGHIQDVDMEGVRVELVQSAMELLGRRTVGFLSGPKIVNVVADAAIEAAPVDASATDSPEAPPEQQS